MYGLVVIRRSAGSRVARDGVERLARCRASQVIAGLYHVWQIIPGIGSGVPGDRASANGEVDVASCK